VELLHRFCGSSAVCTIHSICWPSLWLAAQLPKKKEAKCNQPILYPANVGVPLNFPWAILLVFTAFTFLSCGHGIPSENQCYPSLFRFSWTLDTCQSSCDGFKESLKIIIYFYFFELVVFCVTGEALQAVEQQGRL